MANRFIYEDEDAEGIITIYKPSKDSKPPTMEEIEKIIQQETENLFKAKE